MHYGWEKYELFQDTATSKVLAALVLLKLNGQASDDVHLREMAAEVLGVDVDKTTADMCGNFIISEMVAAFRAKKSDIDPNEEVWLMRAMDPLTPECIRHWIARAKVTGVSSDRIRSAEQQLARIERYAVNHADLKMGGQ
jgi:hypothetical protein